MSLQPRGENRWLQSHEASCRPGAKRLESCPGGGIGRRAGFRYQSSQGGGGSSPFLGMTYDVCVQLQKLRVFVISGPEGLRRRGLAKRSSSPIEPEPHARLGVRIRSARIGFSHGRGQDEAQPRFVRVNASRSCLESMRATSCPGSSREGVLRRDPGDCVQVATSWPMPATITPPAQQPGDSADYRTKSVHAVWTLMLKYFSGTRSRLLTREQREHRMRRLPR